MPSGPSRRRFLRDAAAVAATTLAARRVAAAQEEPRAVVDAITVVSHLTHRYHGWPTVARRSDGELLLVCSGGRASHVCPFGRVELMRSRDAGRTWSWPQVVIDGPIDDRDAGVVETAAGSILITTFTSLAYEPILTNALDRARDRTRRSSTPAGAGDANGEAWPPERLARWLAAHQRVDASGRRAALGVWMIRSTDGGVTWSSPYDCLVNSPHGPIQLSDGRLLYAGKDLWRQPARVGVCESLDDGVTWRWLAAIPARDGDSTDDYHELHAVEAADGRVVVQIRNHNERNRGETLQTESADGGRTWAEPVSIGVWGLPSHLLRLADGRLLMTYGHRRAPLGTQARVSADHGRTWSRPVVVSGDGASGDLGYPSTVQLDDGSLVTVWYELMVGSPQAVLRQARWRLADRDGRVRTPAASARTPRRGRRATPRSGSF